MPEDSQQTQQNSINATFDDYIKMLEQLKLSRAGELKQIALDR